jgi:hypothetical protein
MSVIEHDFGIKKREAERRFTKLLDLNALHEANVRANPLPYLERASERIFRLHEVIFNAAQAVKPPLTEKSGGMKIEVDEAEYLRLQKCRAIVESGFAEFGLPSDEIY